MTAATTTGSSRVTPAQATGALIANIRPAPERPQAANAIPQQTIGTTAAITIQSTTLGSRRITIQSDADALGGGGTQKRAKDGSLTGFALDTGNKRSLPEGTHCHNVFSGQNSNTSFYSILDDRQYARVGVARREDITGMLVNEVLVPEAGNVVFPYGSRSEGTAVALVAVLAGKKAIWKSRVPGIEPLRTSYNPSQQMATYTSGRFVMPYDMHDSSEGVRMAAFDIATGKRIWDVQVQGQYNNVLGISSCPDTVYYTTGMSLCALSLTDGNLVPMRAAGYPEKLARSGFRWRRTVEHFKVRRTNVDVALGNLAPAVRRAALRGPRCLFQ